MKKELHWRHTLIVVALAAICIGGVDSVRAQAAGEAAKVEAAKVESPVPTVTPQDPTEREKIVLRRAEIERDEKESVRDEKTRADQKWVLTLVIGGTLTVFAVLLGGMWLLQLNFRRTIDVTIAQMTHGVSDPTTRNATMLAALRLFQVSPFGVPEGTIRGAIALALVAVGLLILVTHKAVGLDGAGEIAGLLGTVLGFYFGSRTLDSGAQEQAQKAKDDANAANREAGAATMKAEAALEAAKNASADAQEARDVSVVAAATKAAGETGAVTVDAQTEAARRALADQRAVLEVNRQITRALQGQQEGASVARKAESTLAKADALVQAIDVALKGNVSGQELMDVLQRAEALVPELQQVGLPGVFGDAISTLKAAVGPGLQIAAVAGGPAGIVTGLVLAGLSFREQHEKFRKLLEAVLSQPYDRALLPMSVSDTTAAIIVQQTELTKARLEKFPLGKVTGATLLVEAALERDSATNTPLVAANVAARLFQQSEFKASFLDESELAEAIEEVRESTNFNQVRQTLPETIDIAVNGTPTANRSVNLGALLELIPILRRDTRSAAELERIAAVLDVLKSQTGFKDSELLKIVLDALKSGEALAGTSRQTEEAGREE